jgi:hypothetical protein
MKAKGTVGAPTCYDGNVPDAVSEGVPLPGTVSGLIPCTYIVQCTGCSKSLSHIFWESRRFMVRRENRAGNL